MSSLIDHTIILHRPWRTIITCAGDCVSVPSINMWTFNSVFKKIVNYIAHSKAKWKREERLIKPPTGILRLKKAPKENTRLALPANHRRLNSWERVAPVTAHNERSTQHYNKDFSKGRTHFCDLGDKSHNLILICTHRIPSLGYLMFGFSLKWLCGECQYMFRWTVRTRKSFCFCWCLTTEYIKPVNAKIQINI